MTSAPAPGAHVPLHPTIHLFLPRKRFRHHDEEHRIDVRGDEVTAKISDLAETGAFQIKKVEIRTPRAGDIRLHIETVSDPSSEAPRPLRDVTEGLLLDYHVDPAWSAPVAGGEVVVQDAVRDRFFWTCSGQDALFIAPSVGAPLYRLEWANSASEYAAGARHTAYFPHHHGLFWRRSGGDPANQGAEIVAGLASCMGVTLPRSRADDDRFSHPDDLRYFGVAAIYPDGTVIPASDQPYDATRLPVPEMADWTDESSKRARPLLKGPSASNAPLPGDPAPPAPAADHDLLKKLILLVVSSFLAAFVLGASWKPRQA